MSHVGDFIAGPRLAIAPLWFVVLLPEPNLFSSSVCEFWVQRLVFFQPARKFGTRCRPPRRQQNPTIGAFDPIVRGRGAAKASVPPRRPLFRSPGEHGATPAKVPLHSAFDSRVFPGVGEQLAIWEKSSLRSVALLGEFLSLWLPSEPAPLPSPTRRRFSVAGVVEARQCAGVKIKSPFDYASARCQW